MDRTGDIYSNYETVQGQVAYQWLPGGLGRFLEIGCSSGYFTQKLTAKAKEVYGIDINRAHIEEARRNYPAIQFTCADSETLPYSDQQFDAVVMLEVYEHIGDRTKFLNEVSRVLKPGGILVLSTPNKGMFAFLDSFNIKTQFKRLLPGVNAFLTNKVQHFKNTQYTDNLQWHPHFSLEEVRTAMGDRFAIEKVHRGGLLIFPLFAIIRSVTVRMVKSQGLFLALVNIMNLDGHVCYGPLAYNLEIMAHRR